MAGAMRIAVCVKWVPAVARIRFDPETRRIVREGVPHELNSFDALAVQWAVELKRSHDVEVTAYTMGPPQASQGLALCLAKGADRVFHLVDQAFAGSDTLATARALSLALKHETYDLVLFGAHSHDAETGQVGPEVAEPLGLPQVTAARRLDISSDGALATVERQLDDGTEVVECPLPCVIAVAEGVASDAFPGREALMAAMEREIPQLTASDLSSDPTLFGEEGSPTWVAEVRSTEPTRDQWVLEEMTPQEAAAQIVAYLGERGMLAPEARRLRQTRSVTPAAVRPAEGPGVWVVAEHGRKGVTSATRELLGAAHAVAEAVHGHVAAVLLGGPNIGSYAEELGHHGADVVYTAADAMLATYTTEPYASTLSAAIRRHQPYAVLLPSTVNGRDLAARVAARLQLGLTGDCVGLEVDDQGRLVQLKPAFGDNVIAPILSKTTPSMATVRPGFLAQPQPNPARRVQAIPLPVDIPEGPAVRVLESTPEESVDVADLDNAWCLVAVGKGVGGPEHIPALDPLVQALDAQIVCTRDVVEAGWLPKQRQVGLTGRSLRPALYIGVGVRGDFNHVVGIQRAGTVVAINNNRRSPIFRHADIGVVADWQDVVPALVDELRHQLG